jgi:hypothetical protein
MGLSGQLSTMPLGDLLQWIHLGRKTGTLNVTIEDFQKSVYIQQGRVFFASSTKDNERLGQFLIRHEHLTAADLEDCLRIWREHKNTLKLSEIFVGRGFLTNEQMMKRLGELVQEIVYDLFLYEEGAFELLEGYLPAEVKQSFQLDSQWLMFEGLRRLDEYRRNLKELPASDQVLARTGVNEGKLRHLDKDAQTLYRLIDGRRDVEAVLRAAPISVYDAQLQLMALLVNNLVTLKVMTGRELRERRLRRALDTVAAHLGQGELENAREVMDELVHDAPRDDLEVRALEARLEQAVMQEVDRLTGGPDRPLMVDPAVLRGGRQSQLTAEQGFILSRIGERGTLREVLLTSGFPKRHAYGLMLRLMREGLVQRVDTGLGLEPIKRRVR